MHVDYFQIGSHEGNTINDSLFNKDIEKKTVFLVEPVPHLFENLVNNYRIKASNITPSHIENAHFSNKSFCVYLKLHIFILSNFFICFRKSYILLLIFVIQNQPQVIIAIGH